MAGLRYELEGCHHLKVSWSNTFENTSHYIIRIVSDTGATIVDSTTVDSSVTITVEGWNRTINYTCTVQAYNPSGTSDPTSVRIFLSNGELLCMY